MGQGCPVLEQPLRPPSEDNERLIAVGAETSATGGEVLRWPLRGFGRGLSHRLALLAEHIDT